MKATFDKSGVECNITAERLVDVNEPNPKDPTDQQPTKSSSDALEETKS